VSPTAISSSHAAPRHDPFVGTWHVAGYGPGSGMAISKTEYMDAIKSTRPTGV
jgi:hypothetical protein